MVSVLAPSRLNDESFVSWLGEMRRIGTSPGAALALGRSEMNMDVRSILPAIHVPTIVIHLTSDKACDIGEGRYIADKIPEASLIELSGIGHMFYVNPQITDRILSEIRRFVRELEPINANPERVLATIVFTDIISSTVKAAELGDIKWQNLLDQHNSIVLNEIRKFKGKLIKNTGDGFLSTFDGPTRAIKCAWGISQSARNIGIQVRIGVHTGECIMGPSDVSGIAIHIASRVMGEASAEEVLVTITVKDLVYGSGITFKDKGEYALRGIEDKKRLFSVESVAL